VTRQAILYVIAGHPLLVIARSVSDEAISDELQGLPRLRLAMTIKKGRAMAIKEVLYDHANEYSCLTSYVDNSSIGVQ